MPWPIIASIGYTAGVWTVVILNIRRRRAISKVMSLPVSLLRAQAPPFWSPDGDFVAPYPVDYYAVNCPYCLTEVWGQSEDIDSGIRKHLDQCPKNPHTEEGD